MPDHRFSFMSSSVTEVEDYSVIPVQRTRKKSPLFSVKTLQNWGDQLSGQGRIPSINQLLHKIDVHIGSCSDPNLKTLCIEDIVIHTAGKLSGSRPVLCCTMLCIQPGLQVVHRSLGCRITSASSF